MRFVYNRSSICFLLGLVACTSAFSQFAHAQDAPTTDRFVIGPDSKPQDGVPNGKLTAATITSKVYPDVSFKYQVYVPAQYDGSKPGGGDGVSRREQLCARTGAWHVPVVFDNLIAKHEMPVTIGIFIDPSSQQQRSMEYDTLSDVYSRFLIDEVLPEVSKTYKLTNDPEGRAIAGFSSGAICAFTVAWERPDAFRKISSCFGSFTSIGYRPARGDQPMRPGGDLYPTLIRRSPPKSLRIYFQDGSNDLNNQFGNWFLANQQMVSALEWANSNAGRRPGPRYQVAHAWGDGGHTANHGASIFPEILRWLWKDYVSKDEAATTAVSEPVKATAN